MKNSLWVCIMALLAMMPKSAFAEEQSQTIANTDNVVIVVDDSGSMENKFGKRGHEQEKMAGARAALKAVLATIPQSTHIGLISFQKEWLYPLGPRNDALLNAAIDTLSPGRSTPLATYMKKGADVLLQEREKQYGYGTYRLLVVTDGEADSGQPVDEYTADIMSRGITVDVIGVAMASTHTLATKVHSYRAADDRESLERAITQVLGEVSSKGTDVAQDDGFALIAALPDQLAADAIKALGSSGNYPIGEAPPQPAGTVSSTPQGGAAQPASGGIDGTFVLLVILGIIAVVALLTILEKASE